MASKHTHFEKGRYYMFSKFLMIEDYKAIGLIMHWDDLEWTDSFNGVCIYINKIKGNKEIIHLGDYDISVKWCREIDEVRFSKATAKQRYWYTE